jgi:hypothetical protein
MEASAQGEMVRAPEVAVLLAMLAVVGVGCSAISQPSPSPSPTMLHGRVEVPEYGFAVTFPAHWDVDPSGAPGYGEADPEVGPFSALVAWDQPQETADRTHCVMWVDASTRPTVTLVAYTEQRIRGFDVTGAYAPVTLPAGRGMQTTYTYDYDVVLGHTEYVLAKDGVFYTFGCIGEDLPSDGWRSIAETWEWLPKE